MVNDEILAAILVAIEVVKGTPAAEVDDRSSLSDLALDSLDLIEIGMIVEQQLGVVVPTDRFDGIRTLSDVVDIFEVARRDSSTAGPQLE